MPTTFKPRPFDPETDTPACYMTPSSSGRVLSQAIGIPGAKKVQYGRACSLKSTLPGKTGEFVMTLDARLVTCPKCQQTSTFKQAFASQTGTVFDAEKIAAGEPLDEATETSEAIEPE